MPSRRVCAAVVTLALVVQIGAPAVVRAQQTQAQAQQTTAPPQAPPTPPNTPENLDRIKRLVNQPPAVKIEEGRLRFYVEVLARFPTFAEYVKGEDLTKGPVKGGAMTHQEFLNLITPQELYSTAGIKPIEMLQFAIVNWLSHEIADKAITKLRSAYDERQLREIRERIERELAALKADRDK